MLLVAGMVTVAQTPAVAAAAADLTVDTPSIATAVSPTKINVMGLWAHPDDDAGATTPCGVWQDRYDVTCGIIMETRGEGGSNSVGPESGPDLGLRRENEDRTSHVRSGTVNVYNVDMVDFFYNTSAPLTAEVWQKEVGLRQTVRILRETQPDILLASSPVAAGHGNHQYAQGRMVWEAAEAAADPSMYPEQLTGPDAVQTWQVKKIVGGGATTGTGGVAAPDCTVGFTPAAANPFTVVGVWTGYDSPYQWLPGNVQNQPAGTAKTWAQVGREGGRAHPTQARVMEKGLQAPGCTRYSVTKSLVPFQPNSTTAGGSDEAIFFGATVADPGGMPLGSMFHVDVPNYFVAPGVSFTATVSVRSGAGTLDSGLVELQVPTGWTVTKRGLSGPVGSGATVKRSFTVTPPATSVNTLAKISATFDNGPITAYNDTQVSLVQQVEGRFQRAGNPAEYDVWAAEYTWLGGRSAALTKIGAGESVTVPVVVTNRSTSAQSGTVTIAPPGGITADVTSKPFTAVPAGTDVTVDFVLTHTVPTAPASTVTMPITTTAGDVTSAETLSISVVPTTIIPELPTAPTMDATVDAGYGPELSLAGVWEGAPCASATDCGGASAAQLGWYGDDLYVTAHVIDDTASAAAPPERCFGHWLVDSVEILLDPQGDSADTSTTFKSGVFPFTADPTNSNGNGVDGACWSRDADNHQGFSTGPLAADVKGGLNSPGQQVAVQAVRNADGTYTGGGWMVEVKIPLANLPAAVGPTSTAPTGVQSTNTVDPEFLGLNVTPYDSDQQNFIGDTRLAWSAIGGQQSEPSRWGHAYLDGYAPPAGRSSTPATPIIPDTALKSVQSPMSVYQSANRGVTLSGKQPTRAATVDNVKITDTAVTLDVAATEAGTARVFLWHGDPRFVPVWTTSCVGDPYGFEACSPADGAAPPWGLTMGGRLLAQVEAPVAVGSGAVSVPIDAAIHSTLAEDSLVLVSFESASEGVNAWSFPVVSVPPDTVKPTVQQLPPTATKVVPGTVLNFSATDDVALDRIVVNVYRNRGLYEPGQTAANGAKTVTHAVDTTGYPEGSYSVKYNAVDLAGNVSETKTFAFVVRKVTSTTTLKASSGTQSYGTTKPVTVTATVKLGTAATATGQVRFRDGSKVLATTTLSGGKASLKLSRTFAVGSHAITAEFLPTSTATIAGSTSKATRVVVVKAVSKTALRSSSTWVKAGGRMVFAATVTLNTHQKAAGSVRFVLDGRTVGTVKVSGSTARYRLSASTKVGTHRMVATFVPSSASTVAGSTSKTVTVRVVK